VRLRFGTEHPHFLCGLLADEALKIIDPRVIERC
jgi:hypothetical protein